MRLPRRAELSEEQEEFILEAPLDIPVLCIGPPGTGKTVLALYRASFLGKKELETDLIMHSKLLRRYVERSLEELDINSDARTWHSWVYRHWRKGSPRIGIPELERFTPDFLNAVGLLKEGKLSSPASMHWSHLIIDEGQDFPKEFYLFLMVMMMEDSVVRGREKPSMTVFADENQRLEEGRNSTVREIMNYLAIDKSQVFQVTENYRNTARIARLARHFYVGMSTGVPSIPEHRPGKVPVLKRFEGLTDEMASVAHWLYNNDDLSAGIIVANRRIQNRVVNALRPMAEARGLRVQIYRSGINENTVDFYSGGTITVVCDKSCKGLEFDGVFLPQLQHYQHDGANEDFFKMKMYVMVSRAKTHLQLSFSECDQPPSILKMFPADDEEALKWEI